VFAERAAAELSRLAGRRPAPGRLTETERRVAELVARGKSNHEVARELHLSPKTVEWNLSKIYRKLGVRSRTELAVQFAKQRP
jgi:DNA-binding NarL/FixJ family response regulator